MNAINSFRQFCLKRLHFIICFHFISYYYAIKHSIRSFAIFGDITRYSAEERFVRLTNYLKEHSIITCKEYCALTGLLKTKAGSELRQWSSEKKIERNGRAPHVIYRAMPES